MLLARLKVLPSEASVGVAELEASIRSKLPESMKVRGASPEPIAFGLSALILDVIIEEKEGVMESLENSLRTSELVGQVDVVAVSRIQR